MALSGPRVLALPSCDPCGKKVVPPHAEHTGSGCDLWRTLQPFAELRRQHYEPFPNGEPGAQWAWKDGDEALQVAPYFDAVILPRLSWADHRAARNFVDACHRAEQAVIMELDDDLMSPSINRRIKQTTSKDEDLADLERKRLDRLIALRMCDGVTVSSQRLATVMRTLVDAPVCVVPNAIDAPWFRAVVRHARRRVPGLTIGWAGGARPDDDLEPVAWAWGQLAQTHPNITFVVAGHQPDLIAKYVPRHRVRRLPWLPLESYPLLLAEIDIACCSVANQPFNRAKTCIKAWEASLAGSTVVASPTLYGQTVANGVDGLLAETPAEWLAALTRLVDDEPYRRELRAAQLDRIERHHTLARNVWRWPAAWAEIVDSFRAGRRRWVGGLLLARSA